MKNLLELRNKAKRKKPKFRRTDSNKYKQFKNWRKPRGKHNKRRLRKTGHQKNPSIGYSSPRQVRGLTKHGLRPVLVKNIKDLDGITKENAIIISANLGSNKKLKILEKIKELKFQVSNIKDIDGFIQTSKEKLESKKKETKKKKEKREKLKKEAEKRKKEKEEKEKTEEKQKELSKEAKIEEKPKTPVAPTKEQQPKMAKITAPKSQ